MIDQAHNSQLTSTQIIKSGIPPLSQVKIIKMLKLQTSTLLSQYNRLTVSSRQTLKSSYLLTNCKCNLRGHVARIVRAQDTTDSSSSRGGRGSHSQKSNYSRTHRWHSCKLQLFNIKLCKEHQSIMSEESQHTKSLECHDYWKKDDW